MQFLRRQFRSYDHTFKMAAHKLNNKIKKLIFNERKKVWNKFLGNLPHNKNTLWQIKKKLNKNSTHIILLLSTILLLILMKIRQFSHNSALLTSFSHLSLVNDTVNNFFSTTPNPFPEIQLFVIHIIIIKNLKISLSPLVGYYY